MNQALYAAKLQRSKLRAKVRILRAAERLQIDDCVRDKSNMPANYWQPRYQAEEQLRIAERLVEALR